MVKGNLLKLSNLTLAFLSSLILKSFIMLMSSRVSSTPPVSFSATLSGVGSSVITWSGGLENRNVSMFFDGPNLDSAHLKVAVVRTPLGWLLTGVLIVPINGILKIRNGEIIQANHFMRCLGVLKFYRVVKPHLHSRMLENFSLQTLNDLLGVRHCESVLFGSTLLSKSYNKTTREIFVDLSYFAKVTRV